MTNLTLIATIGFNLTTNWTPGYESRTLMWPPEANYSTFTEHGAVYSNEVVRFELYGKAHEITVRSHHILNLGRSYTERTEKVRDYTQHWETPVVPIWEFTNTGTGDLWITNIDTLKWSSVTNKDAIWLNLNGPLGKGAFGACGSLEDK